MFQFALWESRDLVRRCPQKSLQRLWWRGPCTDRKVRSSVLQSKIVKRSVTICDTKENVNEDGRVLSRRIVLLHFSVRPPSPTVTSDEKNRITETSNESSKRNNKTTRSSTQMYLKFLSVFKFPVLHVVIFVHEFLLELLLGFENDLNARTCIITKDGLTTRGWVNILTNLVFAAPVLGTLLCRLSLWKGFRWNGLKPFGAKKRHIVIDDQTTTTLNTQVRRKARVSTLRRHWNRRSSYPKYDSLKQNADSRTSAFFCL